ncbi:hypothetical protein RHMOL_Rhmol12G0082700 [Rhododendron molle]|uniref:Uncharacterized protein n=1 Tax=Rhododendron molle TaxID=49168 RepID=A0ACC0LGU8_RHOML|nr:hypothetical protein RHMOL_Rhmol12G0082700 [Rhododendron molle]
MRSPWLSKLALIFSPRPPRNWLLLCLIGVIVVVALLGSSSSSAFDSVSPTPRPDIYTNYRRIKEQAVSDYLELRSLSSEATSTREFSFCGKDTENYVPCYNLSGNLLVGLKDGEEFDRHCEVSREQLHCLVRPPKEYKIPLKWPAGKDVIWSGNVKISKDQFLSSGSMTKRLMLLEENQISFHSEDGLIYDGVKDYSHQIAEMIGLGSDAEFYQAGVRTVLDIGCGFGSFGAHLLSLKLMVVCIAAYEVTGSQVQLALERGLPAIIGTFISRQLPYPSLSFSMVHCAQCGIFWEKKGVQPNDFYEDFEHWKSVVRNYWSLLTPLIFSDHPKRPGDEDPLPPYNMIRNVMDMNAHYGGLNAAFLEGKQSVWVMNVVPLGVRNTLPLILDQGFAGVLHNCRKSSVNNSPASSSSICCILSLRRHHSTMSTEKEREAHVYTAKLAEQAERYEEMVESMKNVAKLDVELTVEERNLLSVGYKNVIGARRASWRIMSSIEQKEESKGNDHNVKIIKGYCKKVEEELSKICNDILTIIDKHLIPSSKSVEATVFYYKMKGDYYRYIAEFKFDQEKKEAAEQSLKGYEACLNCLWCTDLPIDIAASASANTDLPSTHPIRLGLALNFSVFYYEIMNSPERACHLAKQAFDEAIAELDTLSEDSYKDSTLIMQLLRDNLTLWTSDLPEDGGDEDNIKAEEPKAAEPEQIRQEQPPGLLLQTTQRFMKEASELSVLCDVDIGLFIFSGHGRLHEFCSGNRYRRFIPSKSP